MFKISGFIAIPALANNTPGADSIIGELSNKIKTYSTEQGYYTDTQRPNVRLVSYNAEEDDVAKSIPSPLSNEILRIAQWMYTACVGGTFTASVEDAQAELEVAFGNIAIFRNVGAMVTKDGYWMPESLVLELTAVNIDNSIRLWFSDPAFKSQYDLYELKVVPPVANIDNLVGPRAEVKAVIDAIDVPSHNDRITATAGEQPYTMVNSKNYMWTDPNDEDVQYATPWSIVIYGIAGNNSDGIREAIIDYILENSQYGRDVWEKIYPDLFLPNEFYITPMWANRSLENMRTISSIYSPTALVTQQLAAGVSTFYNIPISHLNEHIAHSTIEYKSLGFVSIGNWKNRNEKYNFLDMWPEFANLSTLSTDFNRMSPSTQVFYLLLVKALIAAEGFDEYSTLPPGMSLAERGSNRYLAFTHEKIQYLVSMPSNVITPWPDNPGGDDSVQYQVNFIVPDSPGGTNTNVQVQLMEKPATSSEFQFVDPSAHEVYWDSVWYDGTGDIIDHVELTGLDTDVVLYNQDLQGTEGSEVRVYVKYRGRVVAGSHTLDFA